MKQRVVLASNGADKNVAIIQNTGDDLVPPLRLQRDPLLIIQDEEPHPLNPQKIVRKKAEVLEYQNSEEEKEHKEERTPWLLEDNEQKAFVGRHVQTRITEDHKSTYYVMVKERSEIKLYRVGRWYKFSPKIQYETLTLEEAEAKMQRKTKEPEPQVAEKEEYREEELEYKEVFDDDDGEVDLERLGNLKRKKLNSAGKDLKKLVQNYELNSSDSSEESSSNATTSPEKSKDAHAAQDITELDIKIHFTSGPISIKSLIDKFKMRFKAHPQSKETLRALIKRMCNIRTDPKTGEKLLVLKGSVTEDK
ncbi:hypothetical protein NEDG_01518 [Nematocida displodere]|uniref:Transcription initiation factor IIF subunit alpha n=1 Tax=Nematocida displodere TaxID=1805483 RepID=A0A177EER4_9MICR|nr:hypothetical protein NEDG_01518 [Nematocida displodere]